MRSNERQIQPLPPRGSTSPRLTKTNTLIYTIQLIMTKEIIERKRDLFHCKARACAPGSCFHCIWEVWVENVHICGIRTPPGTKAGKVTSNTLHHPSAFLLFLRPVKKRTLTPSINHRRKMAQAGPLFASEWLLDYGLLLCCGE